MKSSLRLQHGAALLAAMLTVTLVASLASAALWLQWRQVEIESAERSRAQVQWLLTGALDWTRLILAEDARSGQNVDHLGEPWAIPVQESKLSTFISQDRQWREGDPEAYLSGQITDAQSRLNLGALMSDGMISPAASAAWQRLFQVLNLPMSECDVLLQRWAQAQAAAQSSNKNSNTSTGGPLLPARFDQLIWLGLSPDTLERLRPYATVLPLSTPVNLNTASAPVLAAVIPELDPSAAQQLANQRNQRPWNSLEDVAAALGPLGRQLDQRLHAVSSRYFEVHARIRIDNVLQQELSLIERDGRQARVVWRQSSPSERRPAPLLI